MSKKYFIFFILSFVLVFSGASCVSFGGGKNKTNYSGPGGFFVTKDKGETWQKVSNLPTSSGSKDISTASVYRLRVDPQDPDAFYWASRKDGLLYSYDSAVTWNKASGPLASGFIYDVAVHPENKCIIYATNGRQLFKTDDCGRKWVDMYKESQSNVSIKVIAINHFGNHQVYLGENNGTLLRSDDEGVSWRKVGGFGSTIANIVFDENKENLAYMATKSNGLFRSLDGGDKWSSLNQKLKKYVKTMEYKRLYVYPTESDHVYWISKYGILVSKNAGNDWDPIRLITAPGTVNIYGFGVNPDNEKEIFYTGTSGEISTFYHSTDGGKNWITKKLPTKQVPTVMYMHPKKKDTIYLGFTIPEQ